MANQKPFCKRDHANIPENRFVSGGCKLCYEIRASTPEYKQRAEERNQKRDKKEHVARVMAYYRTPKGYRSARNTKLKVSYGITIDQYDAMILAQENKCLICDVYMCGKTNGVRPCVDHSHDEIRKVRGVLCGRCNMGLGYFRENINFLSKAVEYMRMHAQ